MEGPSMDEEYDEEYDDEEEDEDAEPRVKKNAFALVMMALLQLGISATMLYLAKRYRHSQDRYNVRDIFSGSVGLITGCVGIAAGVAKIELLTRMYFVLQLWLLSTSTGYLYFTNRQDISYQRLCDPYMSYTDEISSYECRSEMAANHAKLALAASGLLLSLAACLVAFDFEDALDDLSDQRKAERLVEEMDKCDDEQDLCGFVMDESQFPSNAGDLGSPFKDENERIPEAKFKDDVAD